MQPKLAISFQQRGLPGLLCIFLGIGLCFVFRNSSAWSGDVKQPMYWFAQLLAAGGANLLGSYVWQKPWSAMKNELAASATLVGTMILL